MKRSVLFLLFTFIIFQEVHPQGSYIITVETGDLNRQDWLVDYSSTQSCPMFDGIFLDAYRYGGGLGYRATGKWNVGKHIS